MVTIHLRLTGSTRSCPKSISQFVQVFSVQPTSTGFPGSPKDSQLEPAPFPLPQGVQCLSEVKSNELERAGLSREQGAGLVPSLLPAAEEILINDRKAANALTCLTCPAVLAHD